MRYIRDNWQHLVLTLCGSIVSTAFALGFAWAGDGNRVSNTEHRLDQIEGTHVDETHWQVQQSTAAIVTIQTEARRTEAEMAQVNTRLGVIDTKLDAIADSLKHRP